MRIAQEQYKSTLAMVEALGEPRMSYVWSNDYTIFLFADPATIMYIVINFKKNYMYLTTQD